MATFANRVNDLANSILLCHFVAKEIQLRPNGSGLEFPNKESVIPAYRATLLPIRWAQVKTALTFLHFVCTSCYITCRRFECFYGESMGKDGQFYWQVSTTNNFTKLFLCQLIVEAYRATLLPNSQGFLSQI